MPLLTRLWIKTALVYFILGLLLGALLAGQSAGIIRLPVQGLFPSYIHFLAVGWISQLIIGVVFWMFPKYTQQRPRRSDVLGWLTYLSLNLGLALRLVGEPLHSTTNAAWGGWLMAGSALLLLTAGAAFVVNTWGRVKEK